MGSVVLELTGEPACIKSSGGDRQVAGLILSTGTYWDLLWVDVSALGVVDMVTNRSAKPSIVRTWLQFLAIPTYVSNFEENGFEDLETIKLICEKDLVEIGVEDQQHRQIILASVKILKEQGAAWVYLLLASQEQQLEKKKKEEKEDLEEETQEDDGFVFFVRAEGSKRWDKQYYRRSKEGGRS